MPRPSRRPSKRDSTKFSSSTSSTPAAKSENKMWLSLVGDKSNQYMLPLLRNVTKKHTDSGVLVFVAQRNGRGVPQPVSAPECGHEYKLFKNLHALLVLPRSRVNERPYMHVSHRDVLSPLAPRELPLSDEPFHSTHCVWYFGANYDRTFITHLASRADRPTVRLSIGVENHVQHTRSEWVHFSLVPISPKSTASCGVVPFNHYYSLPPVALAEISRTALRPIIIDKHFHVSAPPMLYGPAKDRPTTLLEHQALNIMRIKTFPYSDFAENHYNNNYYNYNNSGDNDELINDNDQIDFIEADDDDDDDNNTKQSTSKAASKASSKAASKASSKAAMRINHAENVTVMQLSSHSLDMNPIVDDDDDDDIDSTDTDQSDNNTPVMMMHQSAPPDSPEHQSLDSSLSSSSSSNSLSLSSSNLPLLNTSSNGIASPFPMQLSDPWMGCNRSNTRKMLNNSLDRLFTGVLNTKPVDSILLNCNLASSPLSYSSSSSSSSSLAIRHDRKFSHQARRDTNPVEFYSELENVNDDMLIQVWN